MGAWDRWVGLFRRTELGESLAAFRVACGFCVLLTVGAVVCADLVQAVWTDVADGGFRRLGAQTWLIRALGGPTTQVVWGVVVATLLAGVALVVGFGGRLSALAAAQGVWALVSINPLAGGAYDPLLCNALWLLVLSRSTATLSLDCRLKHGAWVRDVKVPAWPRYLIIFQLVVMYASTAMQKLSVHWTPFGGYSALYYILQQPSWQRFDMGWAAYVYPLTQAGTALTWVWELTAPLLLVAMYYRATRSRTGRLRAAFARFDLRKPFALIGVTMHLLTWILMAVGPFTWITLSYYLCLFHPGELRALWRAGANRVAGRRRAIARPSPS